MIQFSAAHTLRAVSLWVCRSLPHPPFNHSPGIREGQYSRLSLLLLFDCRIPVQARDAVQFTSLSLRQEKIPSRIQSSRPHRSFRWVSSVAGGRLTQPSMAGRPTLWLAAVPRSPRETLFVYPLSTTMATKLPGESLPRVRVEDPGSTLCTLSASVSAALPGLPWL